MGELSGIWAVLKEIKAELKSFDDKWEHHITAAATDRQQLATIGRQVAHIEQLLVRGNGQQSVLVQLAGLHKDVAQLSEDHKALKEANGVVDIDHTALEAEAKKARWMAIAKIAGLVSLTLPGFLALFGFGG